MTSPQRNRAPPCRARALKKCVVGAQHRDAAHQGIDQRKGQIVNKFMQDFTVANDALADAKKQLSDANARARKCRQAVKDAQARVDTLRGYAEAFGVDLDGTDGDNGDAVTEGYPHRFDE